MRRGLWLEVCWYAALAGVAIFVNVARGAEFYVSPTGSNANSGTTAAPWLTLQHAADRVAAGDRVVVRPGTYRGFNLAKNGGPGRPIEFFAEPGVLINQPNTFTNKDGINLELASHVIIDGFAVTGMDRAGVRSVGLEGAMASFVTIRNVTATNNDYWGIFTGHVNDLVIESNKTSGATIEHGIYVSNSGDRPVIRNNQSWNNVGNGIHINGDIHSGGDGVISNALVSGNIIWNNGVQGGSGINMDGVQNSLVENNLIYDAHASGISVYQIDGGEPSSGNTIVNNTIHQASNGRWAINIQGHPARPSDPGAVNTTVLNNILLSNHPSRGSIDISLNSRPGFVSDYNAVISRFTTNGGGSILTLAQWQAQTGQDAHSFVATTAGLFNWSPGDGTTAADYVLSSNSPARNAGTSTQAPAVDLYGTSRPAGAVDIGAIELASEPALTADFNDDGDVDARDLAAWRQAFVASLGGNADGDADSDGSDFLVWQRQVTGPGAVAIPEPPLEAMLLLVASSATALRTRREEP